MAENDFLPFAAAAGANVMTQADYAAASATATGFVSGTASSAAVNKTLRQASIMAAAIAKFIVNETGDNVIDDGTLDTIIASFVDAIRAANPSAGGTVTSVTGAAPITSTGGTTPQIGINIVTESASGAMSAADKIKLDSLPANSNIVHISGTETITGSKTFTGGATCSGSSFSAASVQFLNSASGNAQAVWCGQRYFGTTDIEFVATTDPSNTSADFMRVKTSGDMVLQGGLTATTCNFTSSDRRLKRDIRKFKARPLHRSVPFVSYVLKENGWHGLGSPAQSMQRTAPEHVGEFDWHGKKRLSLNYAGAAYEQAIWAGHELDRLTKRVAQLERSLARAKIEPRKRGFVRRVLEAIW